MTPVQAILRSVVVIPGLLAALIGTGWALQGAYILPANFMRGPEWIGTGVASLGILLTYIGLRHKPKVAVDEAMESLPPATARRIRDESAAIQRD